MVFDESALEKFLDSTAKRATRDMYRRGITLFVQFYGKDVNTILKERKDDLTPRKDENLIDAKNRASRYENLLEQYHAWLLKPLHTINKKPNQAYKLNSARTFCLGLLQLFRYYNMTVTLRSGSPINQTVVATTSFKLMPEHCRKMFHIAKDIRSKLLISLGKDLGWGISDVLSIKRSELPNLEEKAPIEWVRIRKKTNKVAKTCLSAETVALLKEYLFSFPTENPYLFNSDGVGAIDAETVNRRLRDLAEDADIQVGNLKLSWHCFRKMIISIAKNMSIDGDIIKLMVGKSVKKDMLTYMISVDVKTAFEKLQTVLGIDIVGAEPSEGEQALKSKIEQLEATIITLNKDLEAYKTSNETLTKKVKQLETELGKTEDNMTWVSERLRAIEKHFKLKPTRHPKEKRIS